VKKVNRNRNKRAEIASQVVIYIIGLVVISLLLLLGYRAYGTLNEKKCAVQDTSFQTELQAKIESDRPRGTVRIETFTLPCDADEVCFVSRILTDQFDGTNPDATGTDFATDPLASRHTVIAQSVLSGEDTNVFVHTQDGYRPLQQFQKAAAVVLPTGEAIRCISPEDSGVLRIKFNGQGMAVTPEKP
jgi:hypothetical protein